MSKSRRIKTHKVPRTKPIRRPPVQPTAARSDPRTSLTTTGHQLDLVQVAQARRLFWANVVRRMLTDLSRLRASQPEVFDGRIAVLTHAGERIPIAEVDPMFACGLLGSADDREASLAIECTVFRIRTPSGEVFTLPIEEVRALHTLSPELVKELEQQAMDEMGEQEAGSDRPFGLAAFRSLVPRSPVQGLYTESAE